MSPDLVSDSLDDWWAACPDDATLARRGTVPYTGGVRSTMDRLTGKDGTMARYYFNNAEQAKKFVAEVERATEGRLPITRRGAVVTTPHGARHHYTHTVDEISRRFDQEDERERARIADEMQDGLFRTEPCNDPDPAGRRAHWSFYYNAAWEGVIVGGEAYLHHARTGEWRRAVKDAA
jgi:hypothetical protein